MNPNLETNMVDFNDLSRGEDPKQLMYVQDMLQCCVCAMVLL